MQAGRNFAALLARLDRNNPSREARNASQHDPPTYTPKPMTIPLDFKGPDSLKIRQSLGSLNSRPGIPRLRGQHGLPDTFVPGSAQEFLHAFQLKVLSGFWCNSERFFRRSVLADELNRPPSWYSLGFAAFVFVSLFCVLPAVIQFRNYLFAASNTAVSLPVFALAAVILLVFFDATRAELAIRRHLADSGLADRITGGEGESGLLEEPRSRAGAWMSRLMAYLADDTPGGRSALLLYQGDWLLNQRSFILRPEWAGWLILGSALIVGPVLNILYTFNLYSGPLVTTLHPLLLLVPPVLLTAPYLRRWVTSRYLLHYFREQLEGKLDY